MTDPRLNACKGKLVGFVGVIFLAGFAVGAVTDRYLLAPPAVARNEREQVEMAVQHFSQELSLNEGQARELEAVLDEFIMQQADLMSQFQSSRSSGHDRILQILNDDQRQRFEQVLQELRTRRKD